MAARQEQVSGLLIFGVPIAMGLNTMLKLLQGLIIEAVEVEFWFTCSFQVERSLICLCI